MGCISERLQNELGVLQLMLLLQELHRMGYQKLRWLSCMAPTGMSLRCFITIEENIRWNRELKNWHENTWCISTSIDDSGITDIQPYIREMLEDLSQFDLLELGKGKDEPYAAWYDKIVEKAKQRKLPFFYGEYWNAPHGMIHVGNTLYPNPPMSRGYALKKISVYKGDITKMEVDAIVNAANNSLLGGGGIDGVIHKAAGPKLLEECKKLGGCETGQCKMTDAYKLPCCKIIHAVGPKWTHGGGNESTLLTSCYDAALTLAERNYMLSIAFPCISTGIYKYPKIEAANIAIATVLRHLERGTYDGKVIFCCYSEEDSELYKNTLKEYEE